MGSLNVCKCSDRKKENQRSSSYITRSIIIMKRIMITKFSNNSRRMLRSEKCLNGPLINLLLNTWWWKWHSYWQNWEKMIRWRGPLRHDKNMEEEKWIKMTEHLERVSFTPIDENVVTEINSGIVLSYYSTTVLILQLRNLFL